MTRLEMFLAVIIGSCAFLLAAASVSSWTTTRHRVRHGCRTLGVVIDTKVNKGMTGPPSYTLWEARHAVVRYSDRNGQDHTATVGPDRPPGVQIPIVYSPRHPARAQVQVEGSRSDLGCAVVCLIILALLAVFFTT
jgi:hypothetical protein